MGDSSGIHRVRTQRARDGTRTFSGCDSFLPPGTRSFKHGGGRVYKRRKLCADDQTITHARARSSWFERALTFSIELSQQSTNFCTGSYCVNSHLPHPKLGSAWKQSVRLCCIAVHSLGEISAKHLKVIRHSGLTGSIRGPDTQIKKKSSCVPEWSTEP